MCPTISIRACWLTAQLAHWKLLRSRAYIHNYGELSYDIIDMYEKWAHLCVNSLTAFDFLRPVNRQLSFGILFIHSTAICS